MPQKQLPCPVCGTPITIPAKYAMAKSATCGKCRPKSQEQVKTLSFFKKDPLGWTFMTRPWNKEMAKQERLTKEVIDRLVAERYPVRTDADIAPPAVMKRGYFRKDLEKQRYRQEAATSWQKIAYFVCGVAIMSGVAYVVLPGGLIFEGSPVRGDSPTMSPLVQ